YWEEVTFPDGSVRYYNHTIGDYFTSLPGDEDLRATKGQTKTQSPRESYSLEEVPSSMQEAACAGIKDDEENGPCTPSSGKAAGSADSSRSPSPRELEAVSGGKLGEILNVLFTAPEEETRLAMRTIDLSSQGIGPR
ncbi:unnamed protein product, partial [Ascophyllum nodosum]